MGCVSKIDTEVRRKESNGSETPRGFKSRFWSPPSHQKSTVSEKCDPPSWRRRPLFVTLHWSKLPLHTVWIHLGVHWTGQKPDLGLSCEQGHKVTWKQQNNKDWMPECSAGFILLSPFRLSLHKRASALFQWHFREDGSVSSFGCRFTACHLLPLYNQYAVTVKSGLYAVPDAGNCAFFDRTLSFKATDIRSTPPPTTPCHYEPFMVAAKRNWHCWWIWEMAFYFSFRDIACLPPLMLLCMGGTTKGQDGEWTQKTLFWYREANNKLSRLLFST